MKRMKEIFDLIIKTDIRDYNLGLMSGISGNAMAMYFVSNILNKRLYAKNANNLLETISYNIENNLQPSHGNGLAGIGWVYEYLNSQNFISIDTNEVLEDFDLLLPFALRKFIYDGNIDFLHGALGVAFFINKRSKNNKNLLTVLENFIESTEKLCKVNKDGSRKWLFTTDFNKQKINYNLSLSHGLSSLISVLVNFYLNNELSKEKTKLLITTAIQYLLQQEINKDTYGSFFPYLAIESTEIMIGSRLAWCYGDLGIATTLWQAGVALQNEEWKNKALEVLVYAAEKRRDLEKNGVVDAGLCHGTAGIGHIFYRMWWNTRMPEFEHAADYWFEQTLKMAKFTDGLAGYKTWQGTEKGWQNEYGLLEGIAGIGLALLTYYYEVEPTWDECLLLS